MVEQMKVLSYAILYEKFYFESSKYIVSFLFIVLRVR